MDGHDDHVRLRSVLLLEGDRGIHPRILLVGVEPGDEALDAGRLPFGDLLMVGLGQGKEGGQTGDGDEARLPGGLIISLPLPRPDPGFDGLADGGIHIQGQGPGRRLQDLLHGLVETILDGHDHDRGLPQAAQGLRAQTGPEGRRRFQQIPVGQKVRQINACGQAGLQFLDPGPDLRGKISVAFKTEQGPHRRILVFLVGFLGQSRQDDQILLGQAETGGSQ